ncbi:NAD(P)-dependent oxidoreductase [Opitutus terrae]|uniref:NAD-dependent epimerase/dehydratase n=1 Tax=Opitutus terrae (strain DSM 11246 / JCM 15787 / PB90-1) TaxID=452637 RepID=B1ZUK8_OPITP|nr:NAD(P)-dependent oxidoreductase [Opitutus terrae]ACB74051.1 NAD-dependent epimerase/dehydratase [Opitutus terrae PB90-1]
MKIAILGATGRVGSHLLAEALSRGHTVTGLARHPEALAAQPRLRAQRVDANEPEQLAAATAGHEALLSAVHFTDLKASTLLSAVKRSAVPRLLVVGGAGSLEVAPGESLVDTPEFPADYKAEALAARDFLQELRKETDVDWTFLSPSAFLHDGPRTGKFRLGDDTLLVDAQGQSAISIADYAIALIDELERPRHSRRRFTVGY